MTRFSRILRTALFVCPVVLSLQAGVALAQDAPSNDDLRALRFYMEQNQTEAVAAEIRRLQAEFPGWTPPEDLSGFLRTGPTTEIADIYARLARGDLEGARRILQQTRSAFPTWTVPSDLQAQIDLAEGQAALDRTVNARDAAAAVRIVTQTPALLRCDRINNAWNVAELQAGAGNEAAALAAYRQIVATCTTVPDLISTIEKAETVTTNAQLVSLVDVAKQRFPDQTTVFDALGQRLLAGRGVETAAPEPSTAAPEAPPATAPAETPRRTAPATTTAAPRQAAAAPASTPRTSGSVTLPPALDRLPRSGDGRVSQTRSAAQAGDHRTCLARSVAPRSLDLAYERAWCAYNLERPLEALAYFSAAAQGGLGATVSRDARFGMALSFLKKNMTDDASRLAASTDFSLEQRREVESIILNQRGVRAYDSGEYRRAIGYFDALEELDGNLTRDLAILRGYAYLNSGDRPRARALFQDLHNALATAETRAALAAAN